MEGDLYGGMEVDYWHKIWGSLGSMDFRIGWKAIWLVFGDVIAQVGRDFQALSFWWVENGGRICFWHDVWNLVLQELFHAFFIGDNITLS